MSMFIFAGSMEFVTVNLLLLNFNPINALFLTLMVNARHLFYGISMLDKFKNTGVKKFYLIFGMCDESFSINCTVNPPVDIDKGWFMFFVTLLNHIYWVFGATLGGLLGGFIKFDVKGMDFVLTALFVVIFLNQWLEAENHIPAIIRVMSAIICLILFGSQNFMIPSMCLIIICLFVFKNHIEIKEEMIK